MTYTLDFRKKVLAVKEREHLSFEEVTRRFDIGSKNTVFRWSKQLEPCTTRNKPATKIDMDALACDVKRHPDAYQYERAQRLGVSESCVQAALKRLKISHKKNTKASKSRP
jgi:transposase